MARHDSSQACLPRISARPARPLRGLQSRKDPPGRRLALALVASALVHAGIVLALEDLGVSLPVRFLPLESGKASLDSIQLVASQAEPTEASDKPVEPPWELAVSEAVQPVEAAVPPLDRSTAQAHPLRPPGDMPQPLDVPAATAPLEAQVERGAPPAAEPAPAMSAQPPAKAVVEARVDASADVSSVASRAAAGVEADGPPRPVVNPAPVYPAALLALRIEGRVVLRVRVGADGRVQSARVLRSSDHADFDRAALAAVRGWRFEPARQGGIAIPADVAVPVRFVVGE